VGIFLDRLSGYELRTDREKFKLLVEFHTVVAIAMARQRAQVMGRLQDIVATCGPRSE